MTLAPVRTLSPGRAPVGSPALEMADVVEGALGASFGVCREITRTRARNFFHGLRLTPEPKRSALYAIYAWMREVDDIADGDASRETRLERLDEFATRTRLITHNPDERGDALEGWWPAFGATYRAFALDDGPFELTIDGVREDIDAMPSGAEGLTPTYHTIDELRAYCERVASTVGVLCLRVWGVRDPERWPEAHALAIERGVAFQLTNILRDIQEDADEGRCYVPGAVLESNGIDANTLCAWSEPEACTRVIRELAAWARDRYHASEPLEEHVHHDGSAAMWAMTRIYSGLLDRIGADPSRAVRGARVRLPGVVKIGIALRATLRSRFAS